MVNGLLFQVRHTGGDCDDPHCLAWQRRFWLYQKDCVIHCVSKYKIAIFSAWKCVPGS